VCGNPMVSCLEALNPPVELCRLTTYSAHPDLCPLASVVSCIRWAAARQSPCDGGLQSKQWRRREQEPNQSCAFVLLIRFFDPELKDVPPCGVPGRAIEMGAELRRQNSLQCLRFPVWRSRHWGSSSAMKFRSSCREVAGRCTSLPNLPDWADVSEEFASMSLDFRTLGLAIRQCLIGIAQCH